MKQKSFTQKLFAWIFGIFATIIILALAGMLYISVRYKINPIIAYNQIKQINQTVDANALCDSVCFFNQTIGKCALAVVNVCNNTKISDVFLVQFIPQIL